MFKWLRQLKYKFSYTRFKYLENHSQEYKDLEFIYRYLNDSLDYSPAVIFAYHYAYMMNERPNHFLMHVNTQLIDNSLEYLLMRWWNVYKQPY